VVSSAGPFLGSERPADRALDLGDVAHGQRAEHVTCVGRALRLDQQDMCFRVRRRAMLHTARDDEQLSLVELNVSIAQLDREVPANDEEEVVSVVVCLCQTNSPWTLTTRNL